MARRALLPRGQFGDRVSPQPITAADLDNDTLVEGEEITVYSKQVPADKVYTWGAGPHNRDAGNANFAYAKILASGSGTNTDGTTIENAELYLAITDSVQEDTIAKTQFGVLGDLADAESENRRERPVMGEMRPAASEDRYLEIRIKALDSTAGGSEIASDSSVQLYYGQVNAR